MEWKGGGEFEQGREEGGGRMGRGVGWLRREGTGLRAETKR